MLIRDCGIDRKNFRDSLGEINPSCDIVLPGYSATLSNVNAYIGVKQFDDLEKRLKIHREKANKWKEKLSGVKDCKAMESLNGRPNYWVFGILAQQKRDCIQYFRKLGYYASGVHINNNIYSVFGKQATMPGVKEFYDSFVALPCGWWMTL